MKHILIASSGYLRVICRRHNWSDGILPVVKSGKAESMADKRLTADIELTSRSMATSRMKPFIIQKRMADNEYLYPNDPEGV